MSRFFLIAGTSALALAAPAAADPGKDESGKRFEEARKWQEERAKEREKAFEQARKEREKWGEQRRKEREKWAEERRKGREKFVEQRLKEREKFVEQRLKEREKLFEERQKRREKLAEQRAKAFERAFEGRGWDDDDWDDDLDRRRAFAVGQRLNGNGYYLPGAYRPFYADTDDHYYRYDDGNIFRVDRGSNVIAGLIPLLGGGFGVGQLLPAGYDIYNVPLQYRDDYYDTDDAYYRYGDGAIYQVDPETRMIESVVALLTGANLGVGQMLPAGYDVYNVPYPYRDEYYDTDDYLYRYADGNIYQVDAQTQIIQAIIQALV